MSYEQVKALNYLSELEDLLSENYPVLIEWEEHSKADIDIEEFEKRVDQKDFIKLNVLKTSITRLSTVPQTTAHSLVTILEGKVKAKALSIHGQLQNLNMSPSDISVLSLRKIARSIYSMDVQGSIIVGPCPWQGV